LTSARTNSKLLSVTFILSKEKPPVNPKGLKVKPSLKNPFDLLEPAGK
jgi:hypothetical protein